MAFRKRFGEDILAELNELLIPEEDDDNDDHNNGTPRGFTGDGPENDNAGTLIMDATCTPADIRYPQDLDLLNEAREKLEDVMDELHKQCGGSKPRNYRMKARKEFLRVSKTKRKTASQLRKAIRKQLGYVYRDINIIANFILSGARLTTQHQELLNTICTFYEQQRYMECPGPTGQGEA